MLIALLAAGCGSGGLGGTGSVSLDEEWQLGNQLAAEVASQVRLSNDAEALAYVNAVGERIHQQTPLAGRPFHFYIVNDPSVNAFALPGGHVYINSGLIAQADHANMLAGVMAHEISHVVARHSIQQMQQAQGINVLGSILLGQNPSALQSILAQVVAGGAMARFSRADEKQADDLGLGYMAAAGYDPHGMLDMFQKLASLEKTSPSAVEKFFLDHPVTADRIRDISNRISQMRSTSGTVDDPQYQTIRRRVS
ncbi:MAG TPA: M48 family metallopeptidase [Thermoanaerobaculia bacterium]|nr:M48 family metallopeptidase [Thermoanaerobaculia bacterium]